MINCTLRAPTCVVDVLKNGKKNIILFLAVFDLTQLPPPCVSLRIIGKNFNSTAKRTAHDTVNIRQNRCSNFRYLWMISRMAWTFDGGFLFTVLIIAAAYLTNEYRKFVKSVKRLIVLDHPVYVDVYNYPNDEESTSTTTNIDNRPFSMSSTGNILSDLNRDSKSINIPSVAQYGGVDSVTHLKGGEESNNIMDDVESKDGGLEREMLSSNVRKSRERKISESQTTDREKGRHEIVDFMEYLKFVHYVEENPVSFRIFGYTIQWFSISKSIFLFGLGKFLAWLS